MHPGVVIREAPISRRSVLLRSQFQPPIAQRHDPKPEACRALFQAARDCLERSFRRRLQGERVGDVVAAIIIIPLATAVLQSLPVMPQMIPTARANPSTT